MPRPDERDQLVAQLLVAHRLPVLVARLEQHREHVVAIPRARGAALADQPEEELIERRAPRHEAAPGRELAEIEAQRGHDVEDGELREHVQHRLAQRLELRTGGAEDRAQDDVERDGARGRLDREEALERPLVHRAARDLPDRVAVRVHAGAVEGRQQEAPLAQVPLPVHQEQRVAPDEGLHPVERGPDAHVLGTQAEDLADGRLVREDDDRRLRRDPQREGGAVARAAALEEGQHPEHEERALRDRWKARARRQARRSP